MNAFNPTKGIVLYKCGNTISKGMDSFQIKDNSPQQIIVMPTMVIKKVQKDGII